MRRGKSVSGFAAKITLNLVVIAGEIKSERAFAGLENQTPRQSGATFVKMPVQFSDENSRVRVRIAKALLHQFQRGGNLLFPSCLPDNFFEPLGQLNGNHLCPR